MASWREAADPRCPECDGPLASTASYCMHCGVELGMDDSADVSDADDVSYGTSSGTEQRPASNDDGASGPLATVRDLLSFNDTVDVSDSSIGGGRDTEAGGRGGDTAPGHARGGPERSQAAGQSERRRQSRPPRARQQRTPEAASLALRAPTAFVVSLPIGFALLFIVIPSVGQLSGSLAGLVWFSAWLGSIAYLVRKPLPSDIIGDAFYAYAIILLAIPILIGVALALNILLNPASTDDTVGEVALLVVFMEFSFTIPAGILALVGVVANWWAERKLSPDDPRQGEPRR